MIATNREAAPHLTPQSLVGEQFGRNAFGDITIALVGYCPPPDALRKYRPSPTDKQYFIHLSPDSVKRLAHNGMEFLSLAHVYGGPVSASTVEELVYYNFDYILAYGLAGGLGTRLHPLTHSVPKVLVLALGKPFLEHVLADLQRQGFANFVLSVGFLLFTLASVSILSAFGRLLAFAIVTAFLADIVLVPALLTWVYGRSPS